MTRVVGHTLKYEGAGFEYGPSGLRRITGMVGFALCSCGARSEPLSSGGQRKAWHRGHKAEVTAGAEAAPQSVVSEKPAPVRGDLAKATAFVKLVENTLGWAPHSSRHRKLMIASVANRRMENRLFTWDNLEMTVEWLRARRQVVKSPLYVFFKVEEALITGVVPDAPRDIDDLLRHAIERERELERPGWDDWAEQLIRASGRFRQEVYDEWVAAGRNA